MDVISAAISAAVFISAALARFVPWAQHPVVVRIYILRDRLLVSLEKVYGLMRLIEARDNWVDDEKLVTIYVDCEVLQDFHQERLDEAHKMEEEWWAAQVKKTYWFDSSKYLVISLANFLFVQPQYNQLANNMLVVLGGGGL
ncbi:hypothetical protein BKA67DRAFT_661939 [Truncatella angustata]|uniref:Uncharacterized protein n=1 Tax=Truncatella angustata TaxID=152316 RepID=A0A9P8ZUD4_9PEZI|nr:uncharacterized protein BKA67DRAFT_661939 [Truncatella angustata]KAH6649012.1 hypothetical protein BKA67DRAFT_661939 [Truncatella angustata]KAH8201763.1 hypothetical protein TruAng_004027 [Truncatella angustata]